MLENLLPEHQRKHRDPLWKHVIGLVLLVGPVLALAMLCGCLIWFAQ